MTHDTFRTKLRCKNCFEEGSGTAIVGSAS